MIIVNNKFLFHNSTLGFVKSVFRRKKSVLDCRPIIIWEGVTHSMLRGHDD